MFTETKSRLGWRTGASRLAMKEQLESLQSFDPAERAQAGQQLVQLGLTRCAEPLLDHVVNEFDNRVLAAVAGAVVQAPPKPKESRKAQELREWAAAEIERSALEEAFMGGEPESVAFSPEPDFRSVGLEPEPEPLPVRVPVAAVAAIEPTGESAAEPAPIEYRFEVPEPEAEPIEYRPAEPIEYQPAVQPAEQPAPEPIEHRFEGPAPVAGYQVEAYEPEAPHYISWRPPADEDISSGQFTNATAAGNGNGHDPVSWAEPAPALEAEIVEVDEPELEPIEYGFEAPEPAGDTEVFRFEAGAPSEPATEPTNGEPRTLAERLRARDA